MFCQQCGTQQPQDTVKFCSSCGASIEGVNTGPVQQVKPIKALAQTFDSSNLYERVYGWMKTAGIEDPQSMSIVQGFSCRFPPWWLYPLALLLAVFVSPFLGLLLLVGGGLSFYAYYCRAYYLALTADTFVIMRVTVFTHHLKYLHIADDLDTFILKANLENIWIHQPDRANPKVVLSKVNQDPRALEDKMNFSNTALAIVKARTQ